MPSTRTAPKTDLYQQVTDRIVAALEVGTAPWVCPWDRSGGGPHNGSSGHVYRGVNVVLTSMSGFCDPRWYTYRQAASLKGQVRRGEKGTTVVYWAFVEKRKDDRTPEISTHGVAEGAAEDTTDARKIPLLKSYTVFNREQIEWAEADKAEPEPVAPAVGDTTPGLDAARALLASSGANVRHGGVRACYSPADDRITLPEPLRFTSPADYWATALHELTHWTGHESRLARTLGRRFGSEAYAAEELVAELGAAFLCAELGVQGRLQHEEYLGAWVQILRGDKRAIFTAARLAQQAAGFLTKRGAGQGEAGQADEREAA